jgi:hypothetical protein
LLFNLWLFAYCCFIFNCALVDIDVDVDNDIDVDVDIDVDGNIDVVVAVTVAVFNDASMSWQFFIVVLVFPLFHSTRQSQCNDFPV